MGSGGFSWGYRREISVRGGGCYFGASMRGLQVAAAEDAAHGYGVDKVRVGRAVGVGTDFCRHLESSVRARPRKPDSRQNNMMRLARHTYFPHLAIRFSSHVPQRLKPIRKAGR